MKCTPAELNSAMNMYSGGSIERHRHPLVGRVWFTEGMKAVADTAGAYWLWDVLATEFAPIFAKTWRADPRVMGIVTMTVANSKADLTLTLRDDEPYAVTQHINYTDFPSGEWHFYMNMDEVGPDSYVVVIYVPPEH